MLKGRGRTVAEGPVPGCGVIEGGIGELDEERRRASRSRLCSEVSNRGNERADVDILVLGE